MKVRIIAKRGDITQEDTDAIVNAANSTLLGGGGVDGAIHRAAGPELLAECRELGGCAVGAAKVTSGYKLKCRWVIHTVGPYWSGGTQNEPLLLASCYRNSLIEAEKRQVRTIAFPSISTGAYRFPVKQAAPIAIQALHRQAQTSQFLEEIRLVCFSDEILLIYQSVIETFETNRY